MTLAFLKSRCKLRSAVVKMKKGQSAGILWAIFSLTLTIEDFKGFLYKFNSSPKQKKIEIATWPKAKILLSLIHLI